MFLCCAANDDERDQVAGRPGVDRDGPLWCQGSDPDGYSTDDEEDSFTAVLHEGQLLTLHSHRALAAASRASAEGVGLRPPTTGRQAARRRARPRCRACSRSRHRTTPRRRARPRGEEDEPSKFAPAAAPRAAASAGDFVHGARAGRGRRAAPLGRRARGARRGGGEVRLDGDMLCAARTAAGRARRSFLDLRDVMYVERGKRTAGFAQTRAGRQRAAGPAGAAALSGGAARAGGGVAPALDEVPAYLCFSLVTRRPSGT